MRTDGWYRLHGLALLAALVLAFAASGRATGANGPQTPDERQQLRTQAIRTRLEKQLGTVEEKLDDLRELESKLGLQVLQAQAKAVEGIQNTKKIEEKIRKGEKDKTLVRYQQVYAACAKRLLTLDPRYAALDAMFNSMERDLESLGDTSYTNRVKDLRDSIWRSRRANLERVAGMYEGIAAYPLAIQIYAQIVQNLPEEQRSEQALASLKKKVVELKEKTEKMQKEREKHKEKERKEQEKKYRADKD